MLRRAHSQPITARAASGGVRCAEELKEELKEEEQRPWLAYRLAAKLKESELSESPSSTVCPFPTIVALLRQGASAETWRRRALQPISWDSATPLSQLEEFLSRRSASVAAGTVRKDISALKWSLERQVPQSTAAPLRALLDDLQAGLRRSEATEPETKAIPINLSDLTRVVHSEELPVRFMAILAYRSASRVGDVMFLGPRNFRVIDKNTLFISFAITKANMEGENRVDHQVEVAGAADLVRWLKHLKPLTVVHPTLSVPMQVFFTEAHRRKLQQRLKEFPLSKTLIARWQKLRPGNDLMNHYSLHSIKRGAAHQLWLAAAAGKMTPTAVMMVGGVGVVGKSVGRSLGAG